MGDPVRRIHNEFELQDVIERLGADPSLIERDFALVTIATSTTATQVHSPSRSSRS
jgi:hypothetical protein